MKPCTLCAYQKLRRKAASGTCAALTLLAFTGVANNAYAAPATPPVSLPLSPNDPKAVIDPNPQPSLPPIGSVVGQAASPQSITTINGVNYAGDQLLVYFKPEIDEQTRQSVFAQYGLSVLVHAPVNGMYQCRVPLLSDVQSLRNLLRALPVIQDVGLNAIVHADNTPTDIYYSYYYNFVTDQGSPTYQPGYISVQWPLYKMKMAAAWDRSLGNTSYTIAVLDSGIQTAHEDLNPKILRNTSGNLMGNSVYSSSFEDTYGHGSRVAGLAAANTSLGVVGNSLGMAGVCPQSPIYPIKITDSNNMVTEADITTAINMALQIPSVRFINISYGFALASNNPSGGNPDTLSSRTPLNQAILQATNRGVLVLAAMGNDSGEVLEFPAALWNVMAVGATDGSDNKATYSTRGYYNSVAAPGGYYNQGNGWVLSTFNNGNNLYTFFNGTSASTPEVAGLAAVTLALYPSMMPWDLKARLEDTATDTNAIGGTTENNTTYPPCPVLTTTWVGEWSMEMRQHCRRPRNSLHFRPPAATTAPSAFPSGRPIW